MQDDQSVCPLQHSKNSQILLDYCCRKLSPAQTQAIEKHIAVCPQCQEFRDRQEMVWDALDTWNKAIVSSEFDERLRLKLEAEDQRPLFEKIGYRVSSWLDGISMKPALPLAAVFLVWMVGWQVWKPGQSAFQPNQDTSIDQVEADRRAYFQEELTTLQELSESERAVRLQSPEMHSRFSERELTILKNILSRLTTP